MTKLHEYFGPQAPPQKCEEGHPMQKDWLVCPLCGKSPLIVILTVEERVGHIEEVLQELANTKNGKPPKVTKAKASNPGPNWITLQARALKTWWNKV
jgi:hypothetical protein